MYPAAMTTAPMNPMKVSMSESAHFGCRSASHNSAFFSTPFKTEVWILTDCFVEVCFSIVILLELAKVDAPRQKCCV
jgi:hypothetical protein